MTLFEKWTPWQCRAVIVLYAIILFIPFLHQVHLFDWDEINFAEAAREMVLLSNYSTVTINYEPFWEKPPLFFWMQAISMNLFGINEFASRLPNAVCGIFTMLLFFQIGKNFKSTSFGLWWVVLYGSSLLPQLYFRSGIIDPWFNLFIFAGTYFAFKHSLLIGENNGLKWMAVAGICIGLGIMTKGPVALLIFLLTAGAYWVVNEFRAIASFKGLLTFTISLSCIGSLWFVTEFISGRGHIIVEFIDYQIRLLQTQDAGHGGPFFYHWIVLLIGCFPLSIFALISLFKNSENGKAGAFQRLMFLQFWIVLLLFSLVKTKIIHYSSYCYFPLSFIAATGLAQLSKNKRWPLWNKGVFAAIGAIWAILFGTIPILGKNIIMLSTAEFIKDEFAKANFLAEVSWSFIHFIPFLLILSTFLSVLLIKKLEIKWRILALGYTISFTSFMMLIIPNIEGYTQRAAIEFYKSKIQEDCYIDTYGFKSYADLFYSQKPVPSNPKHSNLNWLLFGNADKPVYMVLKITTMTDFEEKFPEFQLLSTKNGFAFYRREKSL